MEYIKTFVLLAVFVILSVACVRNIIRHSIEQKDAKKAAKEKKKKAKEEKRFKRKMRLMGVKIEDPEPEKPEVIREYDLNPDEAESEYADLEALDAIEEADLESDEVMDSAEALEENTEEITE